MGDSIILTNTVPFLLAFIALFLAGVSLFISNKAVAVFLAVASLALTLACLVYALLLGAQLAEVLILILCMLFINMFVFIRPAHKSEREEKDKEEPQEDDKSEGDV